MSGYASSSTRINLRDSYSRFVEHGVAIWLPDFGSVFKHSGFDALDLLHRITTNSLIDLPDGATRQTVLTNEKGRIIDAPWVIKFATDDLLLVSDAPHPQAMQDGISRYTIIEDAELTDVTDRYTRFVVFGDQATHLVLNAFPRANTPVASEFMELGEDNDVLALRTDAAGVATWMIIARCEKADGLLSRFEDLGHNLSGRSLFDFVRITNRAPIVGRELTEDVNPLEAQMRHLIDFDKGCYVGQEVIARLDTYDKVQRKLVAFRDVGDPEDRWKIETGDRIVATEGGRDLGWISSIAVDPVTDVALGLAYVRSRYVNGDDVELAPIGDGIALTA